MSEAAPEAVETEQVETPQPEPDRQPKPTETVEFWKSKAREQESRAKANKAAADELAALREGQKSEAEKVADRLAKADAELASVPNKVADSLRSYLVDLHQIGEEDAELFLTADNPDLLLKQVSRLVARNTPTPKPNHVPREGANPAAPENDGRETARRLFGS